MVLPPGPVPTGAAGPGAVTIGAVAANFGRDLERCVAKVERVVRDARAAGVGSSRSQPSGARVSQTALNSSKPGMLFAAIVRSGPAETRFTRTPSAPRSRAR